MIMNKVSWPWIGSTEHEMGSMAPTGDSFRDINMDSYTNYDSFSLNKSLIDGQEITDFEGGIASPVDGFDWDYYWMVGDKKMEPQEVSDELIDLLDDGDSVLDVGCGTGKHAEYMSRHNLSVTGIDKSNVALKSADDSFDKVVGDIRYFDFGKKFDAFQALSSLEHIDNYKIALKNIYNCLRPKAYGLIHIDKSVADVANFRKDIKRAGFEVVKESDIKLERNGEEFEHQSFVVSKNVSDKVATVVVHRDDETVAMFKCDIAKDYNEKVSGLQAYSSLKENSGLLFHYDRPTDVTYHMGKVAYPIDIIFIDSENKIKKIEKNIQPGSLATFGAASTKYVLEVVGGLSDRVGISNGDSIKIEKGSNDYMGTGRAIGDLGISKSALFRFSSVESPGVYEFAGHPLIVFDREDIVKSASKVKIYSSLIEEFVKKDYSDLHIFDFDKLLGISSVKVFATHEPQGDERIYRTAFDNAVSIDLFDGKEISKEISFKFASSFISSAKDRGWSIVSDSNKSLSGFLDGSDAERMVSEMYKLMKESKNKVVIATSYDEHDLLKALVEKRFNRSLNEVDILNVSEGMVAEEIMKAGHEKFGGQDVTYYKGLDKAAGIPIPEDVRAKAKEASVKFKSVISVIEKSEENLLKNLGEYDKIKDKLDLIPKTKGQFNESVKRNAKIIRSSLVQIRDGVRIMYDIKDISTTEEIILSVIHAGKYYSESAEAVFDLIDKIDSADFYMLLSDKTKVYEKSCSDLKLAIGRMLQYINSNILGIISLN